MIDATHPEGASHRRVIKGLFPPYLTHHRRSAPSKIQPQDRDPYRAVLYKQRHNASKTAAHPHPA